MIIRQFDESISTKCDKILLEKLRHEMKMNYTTIGEQR